MPRGIIKPCHVNQETLMSILRYEPETGDWFWIKSKSNYIKNGSIAGYVRGGRRVIMIGKRAYLAYRLAWLYMTGEYPINEIDHIDRDHSNDKWSNLRVASRSENERNKGAKKSNVSGIKGVKFNKNNGRFYAVVKGDGGKKHCGGGFATAIEAGEMASKMRKNLHGAFASD